MGKLKYTFKTDTLFKILFSKYPDLLKKLVSELLKIRIDSIEQFLITNPDIPPDVIGNKYCRLDISMLVNGKMVDLEVQVESEEDYPDRVLYYWAREYSTALKKGNNYSDLLQTIHISIVNFLMFDCDEFHSEFVLLEVTRHTPLTDKMCLHFFELPKAPDLADKDSKLELWLSLFKADTEEALAKIEALGVPEMKQAIDAYREITVTPEFIEIERLRHKAHHDEMQALHIARKKERMRWEPIVAEKDAIIADKDAALAQKDAEKDAALAQKDAIIAELKAKLDGFS